MLLQGDASRIPLADGSVHCVVTSPPYWGLRKYSGNMAGVWGGDAGCAHEWAGEYQPAGYRSNDSNPGALQSEGNTHRDEYEPSQYCAKCGAWYGELGLEPTPEQYVENMVAVFREVKRVLRDDGTVWLNLGDSYASAWASGRRSVIGNPSRTNRRIQMGEGLKEKDLVGIPWLVAKALQQPYYTGKIKNENDRVWMAAIIDAEGTICGFRHVRKDTGRVRTGINISITNASMAMLNKAQSIWPASRNEHSQAGEGHYGELDVFRWIPHGAERKQLLMTELYPYLVVKQKQALLAWNMLEFMKDGKRLGKSRMAQEIRDKRELLVRLLSELNARREIDIPSWCKEPPSLYEPGWWLRSDIIWSKPNPMPESVTDRPTKAHEYLFLLSKSKQYYYDADAVREVYTKPMNRWGGEKLIAKGHSDWDNGTGQITYRDRDMRPNPAGRNRRTVWQIPTMPYSASVETSHLGLVPVHEVSGGMIHIILPDCPHHGDLFVPLAREFYGGHEADYWNRIERICNRLAQVPFRDCAPTDQQRELGYLEQSLGYFPRVYSPTAIDHSNQTHRMALALDSTPPYIPFFEKILRIDDKRELLSSFVQHLCIYGNSILIDGCDAHLSRSIPHRIVDKSFLESSFLASDIPSCTCLYYRHYTRKPDHFATYPPKLVEPAIKAGTSERGCCPECGAPWERVVERHSSIPLERIDYQQVGAADRRVKLSGPRLAEWKKGHPDKFLGWRPTCDHEHEPIPSTVFDPFAGSGTTLLVARQLGRNGVGVDLSREYLHLARERLSLDALEAWETGKRDTGKGDISELPLFGGG